MPPCSSRVRVRLLLLLAVGLGLPSVILLWHPHTHELTGVRGWIVKIGEMYSDFSLQGLAPRSSPSLGAPVKEQISLSAMFPLMSRQMILDASVCVNTSRRVIAQDPQGSCYGDCFTLRTVGPDIGCPCSCEFIKAPAYSEADRQADAAVRFFHTHWDGNPASVRRPQQKEGQQLIVYIGESSAHYSALRQSEYMRLYNHSIGWRRHGLDTLTPEPGVFIKAVMDGVAAQNKTGESPPVSFEEKRPVSYTHLTLPTNREV